MRKNGFTLIELLAVIVILAIIALIATPIILGIINDAREKANERSVELYGNAVKNGIAVYQLTHPNAPTKFSDLNVQYEGNVECTTKELYRDGSFYLEGCKANGSEKEYSYGTEKICKLSDEDSNGKYSIGDIVTCTFKESTEQFYVIENENEDRTTGMSMLAMYNLYVGSSADSSSLVTTPLENPTGIQSSLAKGNNEDSIWYGVVGINFHWLDDNWNLLPKYGTSYPAFVYDENSSFYPYVSEYEIYLKENGVNSASATLISYEQVKDLKTNKGNPSWLYNTSYWTGSATGEDSYMWIVDASGSVSGNSGDITVPFAYGIRPLVTISTNEI